MTTIFDGLPGIFTDALGQAVTIYPDGGPAVEITAIVSRRPDETAEIIIQVPQISARSVDVADLRDGDRVSIDDADYRAREFEPDGRGMTMVRLEEDPA